MNWLFAAVIAFGLTAAPLRAQDLPPPPAGHYTLDLGHARLLFRVDHLGISKYTAMFTRFDAELQFDPAAPEAMALRVTVDPASVETHYPDAGLDFNAVLAGPEFLDAAQFPQMEFISTKITRTGENTADVTGDLTLHGVTAPVVLATVFNGGYGANSFDPGGARIGFSATGNLLRSAFGIGYGVPAPDSDFGVSDRVEIIIEAEFSNPEAKQP
ncbi:YceI family protein [Pseudorhodobacter sp. E13]|uniref:YceI family protein n=1 Tax=Pseudorhodobacter sp. E13 TaxID=2487931 RepID=UPI000F8E639F|nr:YceI family protein [Pseudorhodobacter sp. E13]